jgi:hypothetical protein
MNDLEKLKEYSSRLHWLKIAEDSVPELYLDHHMMSTFRACEAKFTEEFIYCVAPQGHRVWFLDLGTAVHKMVELYYTHRKDPQFSIPLWATAIASKIWTGLDMDYYRTSEFEKDRKNYSALNGFLGFSTWMLGYATYFSKENERFRVIGTELYFGKSKEVPLFTLSEIESSDYKSELKIGDSFHYMVLREFPFRLYLSGKIDLLVDDGESICPMDHKTKAAFRGSPLIDYEIQDGMTGYVYAARSLVKAFNEVRTDRTPLNRKPTNKIWMNFLQTAYNEKLEERFKRIPLYKTDQQLEDYRLRQIRTASKIYDLLLGLDNGVTPDYDTSHCTNYMHSNCPFQNLHRLDSEAQKVVRANSFVQVKCWNPEEKTKEDLKIGELANDLHQN